MTEKKVWYTERKHTRRKIRLKEKNIIISICIFVNEFLKYL